MSSASVRRERSAVDRLVGCDVGLSQHLGVARQIVGDDLEADPAQTLSDPGGAGEQVARGGHRQLADDPLDQRYQPPFRAEVLDHAADSSERGRSARRIRR